MTAYELGLLPPNVRSRIRFGDGPFSCWEWTGSRHVSGYGLAQIDGCRTRVHRYVYETLKATTVPADLHMDHLCRNRACCNPDHLEPVTARINLVRGIGPAGVNSRKVRCVRGHDLTDEANVIIRMRNGHPNRRCRTCRDARAQIDNAQAAAERAAARAARHG